MLLRQQPVEQIETFRIAGGAVESGDIGVQMLFDFRRTRVELPKHSFDEEDLIGSIGALLLRRNIFERVKHAEKFDEIEMVRRRDVFGAS